MVCWYDLTMYVISYWCAVVWPSFSPARLAHLAPVLVGAGEWWLAGCGFTRVVSGSRRRMPINWLTLCISFVQGWLSFDGSSPGEDRIGLCDEHSSRCSLPGLRHRWAEFNKSALISTYIV